MSFYRYDLHLICACAENVILDAIKTLEIHLIHKRYIDDSGRIHLNILTKEGSQKTIMCPEDFKTKFVCSDGTIHEMELKTRVFPNGQLFHYYC